MLRSTPWLLAAALLVAPAFVTDAQALNQQGIASFYGSKFHGRKTASGERFSNSAMTAAHRSAAFGTKVKVTNLSNGKSVVVRINDRGPFVRGRVIDLSQLAARQIGMKDRGLVRVRVSSL